MNAALKTILPLLFAFLPSAAYADITHVVARGHTIDAIARRYRVSVRAIIDANKLTDPHHLHPGDTLIIPGVDSHGDANAVQAARERVPRHSDSKHGDAKSKYSPTASRTASMSSRTSRSPGAKYETKPKHPDLVHLERLGQDFTVTVTGHGKGAHGKVPPAALKTFEKAMRSGDTTHAIDGRLIALIGIVSNHFGGRTIDIISGYRPHTDGQETAHSNHNPSNHNIGRAIDFKIAGVPNEAVRDYCKTLRNAGVGYYPNSHFVHLDVRDTPTYWVDYSRPGEPPQYDTPNPNTDESTTDVTASPNKDPKEDGDNP